MKLITAALLLGAVSAASGKASACSAHMCFPLDRSDRTKMLSFRQCRSNSTQRPEQQLPPPTWSFHPHGSCLCVLAALPVRHPADRTHVARLCVFSLRLDRPTDMRSAQNRIIVSSGNRSFPMLPVTWGKLSCSGLCRRRMHPLWWFCLVSFAKTRAAHLVPIFRFSPRSSLAMSELGHFP